MRISLNRHSPALARFGVATIFMANATLFANWIARIPDVKARLHLGDATLGMSLLSMAAGALSSQLVAGYTLGRFGSRRTTVTLGALFCASATLPGFAPTLPLLILALFAMGVANGGLDVAMNAQAALVEARYGRPIMSSFHGLWSAGGMIGAALGGVATAHSIPVARHLCLVAAPVFCVMCGAFRLLIRDTGHHDEARDAAKPPLFALPPRALLPLGIIAFGALFCEGAVADWSAVYLREALHSAPGLAATGYAAFSLTMTVGRLSGDWLAAKIGVVTVVRGGGTLVVLGSLCTIFSMAPWGAIAGFGLMGAGLACLFPLAISAAARTSNLATGSAIAAIATSGYTGFLVGPPLIGSLAQSLTLRWALVLLGVFGVLIVVFSNAARPAPGAQNGS